jgi:hypothetical protein
MSQGHVDAGDGVHHERSAAHVPVRAIELLPEMLDARRVLAVEELEERLRQQGRRPGLQGADLAPAVDLLVGFDADVNPGADAMGAQGADADRGTAVRDVGGGILTWRLQGFAVAHVELLRETSSDSRPARSPRGGSVLTR